MSCFHTVSSITHQYCASADGHADVRESLKGESIDFTAMAKTVGAQWQNLAAAEREQYAKTANIAKEQYNNELAEYRKTSNFVAYRQYLADFKAQQGTCRQSNDLFGLHYTS